MQNRSVLVFTGVKPMDSGVPLYEYLAIIKLKGINN